MESMRHLQLDANADDMHRFGFYTALRRHLDYYGCASLPGVIVRFCVAGISGQGV